MAKITQKQLEPILIEHNKWRNSDGKQGQMANLKNTNMQYIKLPGTNLATINFQGACLSEATLTNTNLLNTNLNEADLQGADLTSAKGFSLKQLAGANISGIKLPQDSLKNDLYKGLDRVAETSRNARKIFQLVLLGCIYSLLTIATSTDVALLTNSGSSPLPVIGARVPIVWFYLAAPFLLLCMFIYFHVYLQRLWEQLSCQPAIFPDGKRLDEKVYPWLLNGLACSQFKHLQNSRPPLSMLQHYIYRFIAWWFVPITLGLFWGRHLVRHDWFFTSIHLLLLLASICGATIFYNLFVATFEGKSDFSWIKNNWKTVLARPSCLLSLALFPFLSILAISNPYPKHLELLYSWTNADFIEESVSTKPENWTGESEDEIKLVKGARLKRANLKAAKAYRSFLIKADLREANLENADLRAADLRKAKLQKANLKGADLAHTKLQDAKMQGINLQKTNLQDNDLQSIDLQEAQLQEANLQGVNLSKSNLTKARLDMAELQEANLQETILVSAILRQANLREANLLKVDLQEANLENASLWAANLQKANLGKANLQGANLESAEMQGAELWQVNMQGAILKGADLTGASMQSIYLKGVDLSETIGLTKEQLTSAHIDDKTKLPDYLQKEIQVSLNQ